MTREAKMSQELAHELQSLRDQIAKLRAGEDERRHIEEALRESERTIFQFLEALPIGYS